MAGGGYRGGSTVIRTGNPKIDVVSNGKKKPGEKKLVPEPGTHLLSKQQRRAVMKKVWASRRRSEALAARKATAEKEFRSAAFEKFVSDVRRSKSK
jgi:hypothetical protein